MNIKNFIKPLLILSAFAGFTACEDSRVAFLENYQTMVYFRNGGEQEITLYRVGEDNFYDVPVCKSGHDLEGTATATVVPMNQTQMDIYNIENNTDFQLLPIDDCWYFVDLEDRDKKVEAPIHLTFTSDDAYQVVRIRLRINEISRLQEAATGDEYVIALQTYADPKVSDGINIIILRPEIDIPKISFNTYGLQMYTFSNEDVLAPVYNNSVSLGIDNEWNFETTVSIGDGQWLNSYNQENSTDYAILPEAYYRVYTVDEDDNEVEHEDNMTLVFSEGTRTERFAVQLLDRTRLTPLKEYVLPLIISARNKEDFVIDENSKEWILYFRQDPDFLELRADMLSCPFDYNATTDAVVNLADDSDDTYWGSLFSKNNNVPVDKIYGQFIDLTLDEELTHIIFSYNNRGHANGAPTHIVIGVSNDASDVGKRSQDGAGWIKIGETTSGLPTGSKQWGTLPMFSHGTPFKYVRFGIAASALGSNTSVNNGANMGNLKFTGSNLAVSD